jgi:hypothetical protein
MAELVELRDVADGAARLDLDHDGRIRNPLVFVNLDGADWLLAPAAVAGLAGPTSVVVGVATVQLPEEAAPFLRALTTTIAPAGPGRTWAPGDDRTLASISATVAAAPLASVTMAGLLHLTARAPVFEGLVAESLAYSMLLGAPEFKRWRARTPRRNVRSGDEPILVRREGEVLTVTFNRPERRNAFGRALRDGLIDALQIAELDSSVSAVVLNGNGVSFCSGGDLEEFGTAVDISFAHQLRLQQSAGYAIYRLKERVRAELHGACIGAGIEIPAFASRVEARVGAWFMLPELSMGLLPGAGGTVSITRRIGKWRMAHMALTRAAISLEAALDWGLVDRRV